MIAVDNLITMMYFKLVFTSLCIIFLCKLQAYSQYSSVKLSYTNDYLQKSQLELSINKGIRSFPFSFEVGAALTPDFKSYNIKTGINYYLGLSELVNFSLGFRGVYAFFIEEFSRDRQMATYFDFPIRGEFKIHERFAIGLSFVPTYNTFTFLNEKVVYQTCFGFSYNF